MKRLPALTSFLFAAAALSFTAAAQATSFTVTVTHDLDSARTAEVIAIPFKDVRSRLPGVLLDCVAVKDSQGKIIPSQVTNFVPDANPTPGDELLWQHDFAAGEKSATFTIERTAKPVPPFEQKTFARYVPERFDDFAWENDRIAHRTYGPILNTPSVGKGRLRSSGVDIWLKSVRYPIINRWYLKGQDAYHINSGEGLDMYDVGQSRGDGSAGIWDGQKLHTSDNYISWRILANGPIRTVFELTYSAWDANGTQVSEVKRFTVDAGHNLDQIDSTYTFTGPKELTVAVGLAKMIRNGSAQTGADTAAGWIAAWNTYTFPKALDNPNTGEGSIGIGALLPPGHSLGTAEDPDNTLILTKAVSGIPVRYYAGACWSKDGTGLFPDKAAWEAYLADQALRLKHPVKITIAPLM